jgi:hypothetical protein
MPMNKEKGGGKKPPRKPVTSVKRPVAKKTVAKASAKKTAVKPKANPSKDYMKPVGGTKQEGYKAPGTYLQSDKYGRNTHGAGYGVGSSAQRTPTLGDKIVHNLFARGYDGKLLKGGINPTALKATRGNPKPTTTQMATAKKKAASKAKSKTMETQAQKKKNTKPVKGSTKGSTLTGPKPSPSPSTGRYKRNP